MTNPPNNSGIRDNHHRGAVADFLKTKIHAGSRLSVVSAYFTIYAYDALRENLDQIEHLDFLFGEPRFISSLDPDKTDKKSFKIEDEGLKLANRLEQKRVARDCAEWIRQKVDIRSIRHAQLLHGKMYHIANAAVEEAILGSSNFTVRGLGLGAVSNNIELNLEVDSNRDRRDLKIWFDELWNDPTLVEDVKAEVLQYLGHFTKITRRNSSTLRRFSMFLRTSLPTSRKAVCSTKTSKLWTRVFGRLFLNSNVMASKAQSIKSLNTTAASWPTA
jgi:hypothetical protein